MNYRKISSHKTQYLDDSFCAASEQHIMKPIAQKNVSRMRRQNGFVIEEAWYGAIYNPKLNNNCFPNTIDVTIPLRFFVDNGSLHLPSFSKSQIDGFFDSSFEGEELFLWIRYSNNNKEYCVIYRDEEEVTLPDRCMYILKKLFSILINVFFFYRDHQNRI